LSQVNADAHPAANTPNMRRLAVALTIAATVAGSMVWRTYDADLTRAHAQSTAGATVLATACGPIEYAVAGSGRPLLLIHGAGGGFDQSLLFGRRLLQSGVRIVAPSRFGYLGTPVPADTSAEAQADAHACLLDALGIEQIAVLGASAGAPSAMQFCIRHPRRCRALVLLVPAAYAPAHAGQTMVIPPALQFVVDHVLTTDFALWAIIRTQPGLLVRTMLGTPQHLFQASTAAERAEIVAVLDAVEPVSRRVAGLGIDAQVTSNLPLYPLERITAPTLLISAEDDLYGTHENARFTAQRIAGARFVSYPSGGHLWLGHDAEVWGEVAGFIR
jgi:2-hydroxy-6-oxonona-2,4-dienedioate hydrolase